MLDPRRFVDEQRAYWRSADVDHFRWQTAGPFIAETEAELLRSVPVEPGERLLEIGCGEGSNLHHLRASHPDAQLFGVDFSPEKARFAGAATGAPTVAADAARLPFCDAAFDAVLIRDLLHHLPSRQAALVEALRVLRPGGRLTVIEPNRWNPLIAGMAALIPAERGMLASTVEGIADALCAAGGRVLSVERRQPFPFSRVFLHYKLGAPALGGRAAVARALAALEEGAERIPEALWAYFIVHGRKP